MSKIREYIVKYSYRIKKDDLEELILIFEDKFEELVSNGISEDEAFQRLSKQLKAFNISKMNKLLMYLPYSLLLIIVLVVLLINPFKNENNTSSDESKFQYEFITDTNSIDMLNYVFNVNIDEMENIIKKYDIPIILYIEYYHRNESIQKSVALDNLSNYAGDEDTNKNVINVSLQPIFEVSERNYRFLKYNNLLSNEYVTGYENKGLKILSHSLGETYRFKIANTVSIRERDGEKYQGTNNHYFNDGNSRLSIKYIIGKKMDEETSDIIDELSVNIFDVLNKPMTNEDAFYDNSNVVLSDYDADYIELFTNSNNPWMYLAGIRFIDEFTLSNEGSVTYNMDQDNIYVSITTSDGQSETGVLDGYKTVYNIDFNSNEITIEHNELDLSENRLLDIAEIFKEMFIMQLK